MRSSNSRPVILVTEPAYFENVMGRLRRIGHVIRGKPDRAYLLRTLPRVDAAVIRVETRLDGKILRRAARLKLIASATTGMNHVDTGEARRRGIRMVNLHGIHTIPTAEHTIALMLALLRRIAEVQELMRTGKWDRARWIGAQAHGKTMGIIGLGRIGSRAARLGRALGLDVLAYDPYVPPARFKSARRVTNLSALLRRSDIVSIHAALTDETRGMIGAARLRQFKPCAILINTARGEIVDEIALLGALRAGRIAGAALDVFSQEPLPPGHPLRAYASRRGNLVLTPHLGASTREAVNAAAGEMAAAVGIFFGRA